jgi:hypothetical protein
VDQVVDREEVLAEGLVEDLVEVLLEVLVEVLVEVLEVPMVDREVLEVLMVDQEEVDRTRKGLDLDRVDLEDQGDHIHPVMGLEQVVQTRGVG